MKTPRIPLRHAVGLSLIGLVALAVSPMHAGETFRWGHGWTSNSNPNNDMKVAGQREAHTVVPVRDMDVSQIAIRGGAKRAGTPLYRIGIQNDDGTANHYPNGQWIGGPQQFRDIGNPFQWLGNRYTARHGANDKGNPLPSGHRGGDRRCQQLFQHHRQLPARDTSPQSCRWCL